MVKKRVLVAIILSGLAFTCLAKSDVKAIVMTALAQEFLLMSRPMNEQERQFMSATKRSDTMAETVLGDDYMKDQGRVPVEYLRAPVSLGILSDAANLCDQEREEELRKIVNARAINRGDRMMALAFDKTVGLFIRESLMRHAIEYYRIGEAGQKQSYAKSQRKMLEPEVKRATAERKARLGELQQEMQPMIEDYQRGVRDMLKNDAEKREFKKEADALENELAL